MRKIRQFLAMLMALVIAVTSINMPTISAFAAETGSSEEQTATPTDISVGLTKVDITTGGQMAKFRFTPTEDGKYEIYSDTEEDTYGYLYDADGNQLAYNDDGEDRNFKITYELTAGTTYIIGAKYYSSSTTGSFDMYIKKIVPPTSVSITPKADTFLAGVSYSYIQFGAKASYDDGTEKTADCTSTSVYIGGYKYSVWIKNSDGNYTYTDEYDNEVSYTEKSILDAGTYTVVLTDYTDGETVPADTDKIYDSYTIEVQSPEVYFADRQEISETEEKTFKTNKYVAEYYKFAPATSTDYIFKTNGSTGYVYDSECNRVYSSDSRYAMETGKTYYVGLSGYTSGDDGSIYEVTAKAKACSDPESAVLKITDSVYIAGGYADFKNQAVTITFKNGETESLKLSSSNIHDSYGNSYFVYYSKEGEDWNTNYLYGDFKGDKGKYTISIGRNVSGKKVQLCSKEIEFKSIDEFDIPELVAGENEITSGDDYRNQSYYKIIMPYDGGINVKMHSSMYVYEVSEAGELTRLDNSDNLTGGKTYYAGFYGSCEYWDDDDNYHDEYTWKTDVSFIPAVKTISAVSEKTEVASGTDAVCATVDITYVNGDTEKQGHITGSFTTDKDQKITVTCKSGDKEYDSDELPAGTATIVFTAANGVTCKYDIEVKSMANIEVPELKAGENEITSGESYNSQNYYKFTMPYDGKIRFSAIEYYTIYEISEAGSLVKVDNEDNLKGNKTYYIGLYGGREIYDEDDNWTEVYTWKTEIYFASAVKDMKVTPEKTEILYGTAPALATVEITFADNSKETFEHVSDSFYTKNSFCIDVKYKVGDTEYDYWRSLPIGKVTVIIQAPNGVKAEYQTEIKNANDYKYKELKTGSNDITVGTDSYNQEYYKFTMPYGGKISISSNEDNKYVYFDIYDIDTAGSLQELSNKNLEEGHTYYVGIYGDEDYLDGDYTCSADVSVVPAIKSIKATPKETEVIKGQKAIYADLELTYVDGSTETVNDVTTNFYTKTRYKISITCKSGDKKYNALYLPVGKATVTYTAPNGVSASYDIEVKSVDDMKLTALAVGNNSIESGIDKNHSKFYTFTATSDGALQISKYKNFVVYELDEDGDFQVTDEENLKAGKTYYIAFYGKLYDKTAGEYIYAWNTDVSFVSAIDTMTAKSNITDAVYGENPVNASVGITYKDKTTENIPVATATDAFRTQNGQKITVTCKSGESIYDYYDLPIGTATIIFSSSNGVKAQYDVNIKKLSDVAIGELKLGSNDIDVSDRTAGYAYYKFTPDETARYTFSSVNEMSIYREEVDSDGIYTTRYVGGPDSKLEKGVTYVINLYNGGVDKWGDIQYKWTLDISLPELGKIYDPASWKLKAAADDIYFMTDEDSDNVINTLAEKAAVQITYSNNSTQILSLNRRTDTYGNRLTYSYYKYNDETAAYDKLRYLPYSMEKGKYKLVETLCTEEGDAINTLGDIEVLFEVKGVLDLVNGDWDISKELSITNDKNIYVYRLTNIGAAESLTFKSNTTLNGMSLYDENGEYVSMDKYFSAVYDCAYSVNIAADKTYYLLVKPSESSPLSKITAVQNNQVTGLAATVTQDEYWCEIDPVDPDGITTVITYADGTQKTVTGTGSGVNLSIKNIGANNYASIGSCIGTAGEYAITPSAPNMSKDCDVKTAVITAKAFDVNKLTEFDTTNKLTVSNPSDKMQTQLYVLKSSGKQYLKLDIDGGVDVRVYKYVGLDDCFDRVGSEDRGYQLYKNCTYVIAVDVQAKGSAEIAAVLEGNEASVVDGGTLVAGKNVDVNIDNAGNIVKYEFTPEESATYIFQSSGSYDTYGILCDSDENEILYNDDGGESSNFKIARSLTGGKKYIYKVRMYSSDETGSFTVRLDKVEKKKVKSAVVDEEESYIESDGDFYGYIDVVYDDEATDSIKASAGSFSDVYGNRYQLTVTTSEESGEKTALVELRYKNTGSDEWNYVDGVKFKLGTARRDTWDGELKEGVAFEKTIDSTCSGRFKFVPETSGSYIVSVNDSAPYSIDVKNVDDDWYVYMTSGAYVLKAGYTYSIEIDPSDYEGTISILVVKPQIIDSVEITGYDAKIYNIGDDVYSERPVKAVVKYTDGTTETISGSTSLKDGRSVSYEWSKEDAEGAMLKVTAGGVTGYKKIPYTSLDELAATEFVSDVATLSAEGSYTSNDCKNVYKVVIPKDGVYSVTGGSVSGRIVLHRGNNSGVTIREGKKYSLKKGDICYICIYSNYESDIMFGCVGDISWEIVTAPTCTEKGLKRTWNELTEEYEKEEIPALGHKFTDEWTVKTPATMTSDGTKVLVCDRCDAEKEDSAQTITRLKSVVLSTSQYTYDGTAKRPSVVVTDADDKVVGDEYYTVSYKNNVEVGTATATITFDDAYLGSVDKTYEIVDSGLTWEITTPPTCTDDGQKRAYNEETGEYEYEVIPATGHTYGEKWIVKKAATTAEDGLRIQKCTVCGYEDTVNAQTIAQIKSIVLEYTSVAADGTEKKPAVTVMDTNDIVIPAANYTVAYKDNKEVGVATVEVTFAGDYAGEATATFDIVSNETRVVVVEKATCTKDGLKRYYNIQTGEMVKEEKIYAFNHNFSGIYRTKTSATAEADGVKVAVCSRCGAEDNTKTQPIYKIASVILEYEKSTYTGTEKRPGVIVKDSQGNVIDASNYSVEYTNNKNVGTANAAVTFGGDYSGTVNKTFAIVGTDLKWEITKEPTCTTKGEKRALNPITGLWESQFIPAKGHSFGSEWKLKTAATTTSDGKRVHICGTCGAEDLANAQAVSRINTVTLAYSTVTYNGKDQKPAVTVKDAQGKVVAAANYTVAYKNNRNAGTATVTVTFKGDYTGTVTRTFTIKANAVKVASTAIKKIENVSGGVKLTWKKISGVNGYYVYRQTGKGKFVKVKTIKGASSLSFKDTAAKKNGTKYTYKVCAYKSVSGKTYTSSYSSAKATCYVSAPKCKSVSNVKGKKMKVVYSKNAKATGYQIQYSVKSSFKGAKTVKVKGAKNVSKVISKLTKGKKYYVRVRGYKVSGGKTYTSAWSAKKVVSIKK